MLHTLDPYALERDDEKSKKSDLEDLQKVYAPMARG